MIRAAFATLCTALLAGCAQTTLESGENHPANPRAATPPLSEIPPTLRPGFDPHGDVAGDKSGEAHDHQSHDHHQHHHHHPDPEPDQHQHQHAPAPADGGTR
jgi:hypothetical protein